MAVEIVMPHLSDSMEEGTIVHWFVSEGDVVAEGAPLVEVETDKATVTYDAERDGTVLALSAHAGDSVAVGAVIAIIGEPGEAVPDAAPASDTAPVAAANANVAANAGDGAGDGDGPAIAAAGATPATVNASAGGTTTAAPPAPPAPPTAASAGVASAASGAPRPAASGGRVKASPLARRVAADFGVDLATLVGSGPQGRVIRSDVERSVAGSGPEDPAGPGRPATVTPATASSAASTTPASTTPASTAPASTTPASTTPASAAPADSRANGAPGDASTADGARGATSREPLNRLQQTIARRMAQSRATVPDFELRCEVDMTAAVALRERIRAVIEPPPSYNDLIVKAAALALREFPRVNGAYHGDAFEYYERVNIGIAVAARDALVVPTIFDADTRSLSQIGAAARDLAAKVRDGSISPAELSGGTFSISNLGMHGIDSFSAVLNAPQAAILAVGSLKPRPVVDDDGAIVARATLHLTLACDHRILYGADGAQFLVRVRDLLQAPLAMLI